MEKNKLVTDTRSVSEKRRRLLKVAAGAAPVVATLQSGAAFAQLSAFICIKRGGMENPPPSAPVNDRWVRVPTKRYIFTRPNGSTTDWAWDLDGLLDNIPTVPYTLVQDTGPLYLAADDGTGMGQELTALAGWQVTQVESVFVLRYFEPNDDDTDATELGPYPRYLETYSTTSGGVTALDGSCFCSVYPGDPGCV